MSISEFKILLKSCGFTYCRRAKGSHVVWINSTGETFSFPDSGKEIRKGIVWNFRRNYT